MRKAFLLSAALLAAPAVAQAQVSGNISAQATVLQPLVVTGANTLDFGNVFPGVNKSVAVTDATAGRFDVTGVASSNVELTFTLPANLSDGGVNTMPITAWTGNHNGTNSPTGTGFTPSGAATAAALSGAGALFVFVGATVQPAGAQVAGLYTGQVDLTVSYTGS